MTRLRPRRAIDCLLFAILACALIRACGGARIRGTSQPGLPSSGHGQPSEATTSTAVADDTGHDHDLGALTPARRAQLGLAGVGPVPGLSAQQRSDAQAIAAQWVLTDTTYAASDDPVAVNARRSALATAPLAAELAASSSGGARLEELRRRRARFAGEVLAVSTDRATADLAVVEITAAVTVTTSDKPPDRRVRFYRITLGREVSGYWLVARAEQS